MCLPSLCSEGTVKRLEETIFPRFQGIFVNIFKEFLAEPTDEDLAKNPEFFVQIYYQR